MKDERPAQIPGGEPIFYLPYSIALVYWRPLRENLGTRLFPGSHDCFVFTNRESSRVETGRGRVKGSARQS